MKLTIPTLLTMFRIVLIPVLVVVFYLPQSWTNFVATFVFVLGAATDWADGWIARRWNMHSAFGAFLDPVADKLAVTVALLLIVEKHPTHWMTLLAAVIIGREIAVSALREWMAEIGQRGRMKVAWLGKIKMVAISCLLYVADIAGVPIFRIGEWLLAVAAALTLVSGFTYLRAAWPALRDES
jgi:CDP-diacylglycerol--glycerol-3-phosphate 3-phosphatidyltransferase